MDECQKIARISGNLKKTFEGNFGRGRYGTAMVQLIILHYAMCNLIDKCFDNIEVKLG